MKTNKKMDYKQFIVWFSDKVYELSKLFSAQIEDGLLEGNVPQIAAYIFEIRSSMPNIKLV